MSPYISTAAFILKHFISYLSKDHSAILTLLYLSSVYPNQKKKEADCTLLESHQIKPLTVVSIETHREALHFSIKPVHKLSALLNARLSKTPISSFII